MRRSRLFPLCSSSLFAVLIGMSALAQSGPVPIVHQPNSRPFEVMVKGPGSRTSVSSAAQTSAPNFSEHGYIVFSSDATYAAVADMNGDGIPDLAVAGDSQVSVLLGNGDGTFKGAVGYGSGGIGANFVAIADVNGDGKPDLVVSNLNIDSFNGSIGVLLGNGDGTFQPAVSYSSGGQRTVSVAIADVNGDGKPDLLVTSLCPIGSSCNSPTIDGLVSVLLNNGDGTFQAAETYDSGGLGAAAVAVADVNGDGIPDLLVVDECTSSSCSNGALAVLLGNGNGTFQAAVTYDAGIPTALAIAVSDLNADGKLDAVLAGTSSGGSAGAAAVLLGNGDGTFQTGVEYSSGGEESEGVAVADLNGDGIPDIAVGNFCQGMLVYSWAKVMVPSQQA